MADDEALEWVVHTLVAEGLRSAPICGQPDSGPPPFGHPIRLVVCPACMEFGPAGMPRELTMRHHVSVVREQLREKLRRMSEQERDRYREQVRMIAAASLQDPEAAPALYDEGRLMAALYAIGAIRSGFFQLRRAGIEPTWTLLEEGLIQCEIITLVLAENPPI